MIKKESAAFVEYDPVIGARSPDEAVRFYGNGDTTDGDLSSRFRQYSPPSGSFMMVPGTHKEDDPAEDDFDR